MSIPVQDLPENQDPSVRWTLNQQTGEVIPWDVPETGVLEEPKPKRGRPRKQAAAVPDDGAESPVEIAATSVRELGS